MRSAQGGTLLKRFGYRWLGLLLLMCLIFGCEGGMLRKQTPIQAGYNPIELLDVAAEEKASTDYDVRKAYQISEEIRITRPASPSAKKRHVLCLSGGGTFGAFSAGVLSGWTTTGTRPEFDVVTGISTGALIAPLAFLGPAYDKDLEEFYTTIRQNDVFRIRRTLSAMLLFNDSVADNGPLSKKIDSVVTLEMLKNIAREHKRGRRLYVGTTELESRRAVVWDMGEIATRGTPDDLELFRKVLLASAAIPGLFSPVRLPVTVDGKQLEERHVDGSVSNAVFFRAPYRSPEERAIEGDNWLNGTNVYVLLAGKIYADGDRVKLRSLFIAADSITGLLYAQARGDLLRVYINCIITGMNYYIAALPPDAESPKSATEFKPEPMKKLFQAGRELALSSTPWRLTPPGVQQGEGYFMRDSTKLKRVPLTEEVPTGVPQR
jgi:predicted patatin/cPLA2 family phospholipase